MLCGVPKLKISLHSLKAVWHYDKEPNNTLQMLTAIDWFLISVFT